MTPTTEVAGLEFVIGEVSISHSGPLTFLSYVAHLEDMQDSLSKHIYEVKSQREWFSLSANPALRSWRSWAHRFNTKAKTMAFFIKSISMEINS